MKPHDQIIAEAAGRLRKAVKRWKRINPVSKRQQQRFREYRKVRKEFLREHPVCECCRVINLNPILHRATEIHHVRGRIGSLLCDTRFFKATCFQAHHWIGHHPQEARKLGLLCELGKWNTPEP